LFNKKGFSEVSIDDVMANAGLTHGGFYRHFSGKDELYAAAIRQFLCGAEPEPWQTAQPASCADGKSRAQRVIEAYLSRGHLDDREGCCRWSAYHPTCPGVAMSLRPPIGTSWKVWSALFEADLGEADKWERALVLLALAVGGMVVAKAVEHHSLADDVCTAARQAAIRTAGWGLSKSSQKWSSQFWGKNSAKTRNRSAGRRMAS
jgi:TetR/AcrR family transcriptional regulator, transcriptional repressor for nem operon